MSFFETTQPQQCGASLEVHLLGLVDFEAALFLQERLAYDISGRRDTQGALLICEHPPLITVGREGSRTHIHCTDEELKARMLQTRWLNRGGGCVVHVPGQLAVYPIIPLKRMGMGLMQFRESLEEAVIDLCREQKIAASRDAQQPGVFCRTGQLAQIGIAVRSWVSSHGLFLNVSPNLTWTRLAQPVSPSGRLTSLQAARSKPVSIPTIRESLIHHLAGRLEYGRLHLYTGHRFLKRTKKATVYA